MYIADSLVLLVPMDDKKQLLCWSHGLNRSWLDCRAVDPSIVRVVGCAESRSGGSDSGTISGQKEGGHSHRSHVLCWDTATINSCDL
jgi:hypothetical protein